MLVTSKAAGRDWCRGGQRGFSLPSDSGSWESVVDWRGEGGDPFRVPSKNGFLWLFGTGVSVKESETLLTGKGGRKLGGGPVIIKTEFFESFGVDGGNVAPKIFQETSKTPRLGRKTNTVGF